MIISKSYSQSSVNLVDYKLKKRMKTNENLKRKTQVSMTKYFQM